MAQDQHAGQQNLRTANEQLREVQSELRATKKRRILDAYEMVDPLHRGSIAEVVSAGGNNVDWIMRVRDGIGRASTKKVARMIAIVRSSLDPEFTGDAPARVSDAHLATIQRKRSNLLAQLEEVKANPPRCTVKTEPPYTVTEP